MGSKVELYVHLVWATWTRRPMVSAEEVIVRGDW